MIRRRRKGLRRNANPNFMIQPRANTGIVRPQQQHVRRTATPPPSSSTTTGIPQQEQGGGLLQEAINMKGAYEGGKDAIAGGKKAGEFIRNFPEKLDAYGNSVSEVLGLQHTKNGNIVNASNPPLERAQNAYSGLLGKQQNAISNTYGHTGGTALPNASGPTDAGFNALSATDMVPKAGEFQFGASQVGNGAGQAGSQLSTGANVAGKATPEVAAAGGPSMMGAAGGALGVGLGAMDIAENGANFGNVTGTLGSAALGGAALAGPGTALAAALGPVGWAALGASVLSSFF
jgi:hypothetical protein